MNARFSSVKVVWTVTCSRRSAIRALSRAPCSRRMPSGSQESPAMMSPVKPSLTSTNTWQGHGELRAPADAVARRRDMAAEKLYQIFHDRQAETKTAGRFREKSG